MKRSIALLAVLASSFVWTQWQSADRQAETSAAVKANCTVVSVLLSNRADRDQTIKLFDPIRRENPEQFDALVKKAEKGDARLQRVQGDLACDLPHPKRK